MVIPRGVKCLKKPCKDGFVINTNHFLFVQFLNLILTWFAWNNNFGNK